MIKVAKSASFGPVLALLWLPLNLVRVIRARGVDLSDMTWTWAINLMTCNLTWTWACWLENTWYFSQNPNIKTCYLKSVQSTERLSLCCVRTCACLDSRLSCLNRDLSRVLPVLTPDLTRVLRAKTCDLIETCLPWLESCLFWLETCLPLLVTWLESCLSWIETWFVNCLCWVKT